MRGDGRKRESAEIGIPVFLDDLEILLNGLSALEGVSVTGEKVVDGKPPERFDAVPENTPGAAGKIGPPDSLGKDHVACEQGLQVLQIKTDRSGGMTGGQKNPEGKVPDGKISLPEEKSGSGRA